MRDVKEFCKRSSEKGGEEERGSEQVRFGGVAGEKPKRAFVQERVL